MDDDTLTLASLLDQMEAQHTRMSVKNPTKRLLWLAAAVLVQQAQQIVALTEKKQSSPLILPGSAS